MSVWNSAKVTDMLGKIPVRVEQTAMDEILFVFDDCKYRLYHQQECCENVAIEDICGDLQDLVGSPLTLAEETTNAEGEPKSEYEDSYTWTFYRFATVKGYVTIRWYGSSNGYYSESVDFEAVKLNRQEELAKSCGLRIDTHPPIVADKLEEEGREAEANELRQAIS